MGQWYSTRLEIKETLWFLLNFLKAGKGDFKLPPRKSHRKKPRLNLNFLKAGKGDFKLPPRKSHRKKPRLNLNFL